MSKVDLDAEEKKLREELRKLPRKKWPSLRSIVVGLIFVLGSPYFPFKGGALIERQSYAEAVWPMGILFLFLLPVSYYWNIKQVNDDMMAIEHKLIRLKYRRKEIEEKRNRGAKYTRSINRYIGACKGLSTMECKAFSCYCFKEVELELGERLIGGNHQALSIS